VNACHALSAVRTCWCDRQPTIAWRSISLTISVRIPWTP